MYTPNLKKMLSRLMLLMAAAIMTNVCLYWLPHSIAGFIYRSHLPTATEKTLALTRHDYARS
ncbi:hypothetical protein JCM14076_02960 [Methylosoma difficile]